MSTGNTSEQQEAKIRTRAHEIFELKVRPDCKNSDRWTQAEQKLTETPWASYGERLGKQRSKGTAAIRSAPTSEQLPSRPIMNMEEPSVDQCLCDPFDRVLSIPEQKPKRLYRWYVAYTNSPDQTTKISLHATKSEAVATAFDFLTQNTEVLEIGPLLEFGGTINAVEITKLYASYLITESYLGVP